MDQRRKKKRRGWPDFASLLSQHKRVKKRERTKARRKNREGALRRLSLRLAALQRICTARVASSSVAKSDNVGDAEADACPDPRPRRIQRLPETRTHQFQPLPLLSEFLETAPPLSRLACLPSASVSRHRESRALCFLCAGRFRTATYGVRIRQAERLAASGGTALRVRSRKVSRAT